MRSRTYSVGYYLVWFKLFKNVMGKKFREVYSLLRQNQKIYFKDIHLSKNMFLILEQNGVDKLIAKFVAPKNV